jgi:hypothetical protein
MLAQIHPITLDKDYVNSKASSTRYPAKAHAPTPYLEEIIGGCDPFYKKKDDPFNPSPSSPFLFHQKIRHSGLPGSTPFTNTHG